GAAGDTTVRIVTRTAGTAIDLGGGNAAGILGLTDAELDRVAAGTLQIGKGNSGAITVSAAIDLTAGANTVPVLLLVTGGGVSQSGSGALNVSKLAIGAANTVDLGTNANAV